jgi:hypothetical protein
MTTAPRICNHALTVYKAAFTPINSTSANATSLPCKPDSPAVAVAAEGAPVFRWGSKDPETGKYLSKDLRHILLDFGAAEDASVT